MVLRRFIPLSSIVIAIGIIIAFTTRWISCDEKPHEKHYGLWMGVNMTENPALFFTMVGARPVAVLWLLSISVGFAVELTSKIDTNRERSKSARRIANTLILYTLVASSATTIPFEIEAPSIHLGRGCDHFQIGSTTALLAYALCIAQALVAWLTEADCLRQADDAPVSEEAEAQGNEEAETQGNEETVIYWGDGAENQGIEDTVSNGAENQGIEETVINGSNGAETQEPQITDV